MAETSEPDPEAGQRDEHRPVSWLRAIVAYVVLGGVVGVGAVFGMIAMVPVGLVLVIGAIPYTAIATIVVIRRRSAARAGLGSMPEPPIDGVAVIFGGWSQKLSFMNGLVLGVLGIVLIVSPLTLSWLADGALPLFVMALIAAFSVIEILVNIGWIYPRQTAEAEEYALLTRTHSWRLILANRGIGWGIWYTGATVAAFLLLGQGFALVTQAFLL